MNLFIGFLICYLIGSIPFGYLVVRLKDIDIRKIGSGNIGATNVKRILGIKGFIIVFFLDFCKGFIILWLTPLFFSYTTSLHFIIFGLAVFFGHLYPVWFYFKTGGKGVATTAGILLVILPWHYLITVFLVFLLVIKLSNLVSLGSLSAAVTLLIYHFVVSKPFSHNNIFLTVFIIIMSIFVIYKHKENIKRIIKKQESKTYFIRRK